MECSTHGPGRVLLKPGQVLQFLLSGKLSTHGPGRVLLKPGPVFRNPVRSSRNLVRSCSNNRFSARFLLNDEECNRRREVNNFSQFSLDIFNSSLWGKTFVTSFTFVRHLVFEFKYYFFIPFLVIIFNHVFFNEFLFCCN